MRINGPVTNALQPQFHREIVGRDDLVQVETVRSEYELRSVTARDESFDSAGRGGEACSGPHSVVRCGCRAIHRNLHALQGERSKAVGGGIIDPLPIGL